MKWTKKTGKAGAVKSFLLAAALLLACAMPAAAATLENPGYPGDVTAQAEMLRALSLFRGTEEGFALARAMRRDEAATMLVRYLGAEAQAEAGGWQHPFTDVPAWANDHVGWLYQSGLTKGVSDTRYGAAQAVTAGQFHIFLSRAASGQDNAGIASAQELAACDKAGFTRGDAVVLAARALSAPYTRDGGGKTMAQYLITQDVFTEMQFEAAAFGVLPASSGTIQGEEIYAVLDGRIITQSVTAEQTLIHCRDAASGAILDGYTIPNEYIPLAGEDASARETFAPRLLGHNTVYLWGDAGLYRMQEGRLVQITSRAAIDYGYDPSDNSHVILTHAPGKRVIYPAKTGLAYNPAGDQIVRIRSDGSEVLLLSDTPPHGQTFYKLARASGGEVRALNWNWVLEYAVENGKIRVYPPSNTHNPEQYRDVIAQEQARLDRLGAGVGWGK